MILKCKYCPHIQSAPPFKSCVEKKFICLDCFKEMENKPFATTIERTLKKEDNKQQRRKTKGFAS